MTDDDRTSAVGLFNYAHSYWASASTLQAARVEATHPDAPVDYLYFHAIELFFKAFLRSSGMAVSELKKLRHGMLELAKEAERRGLELTPEDHAVVCLISPNYLPSRYIEVGAFKRASWDALWGTCSWLFDYIGDELIRLNQTNRLPIRPLHPNNKEVHKD